MTKLDNGKVSIIIPVYNAEQYISRCLESLLIQTYNNLEILLIDDGSQDGSLLVCEEYAKRDCRISVFHHSNHGVSYTRNYGLNCANGEYITFIDADDWVEPDYISRLHQMITSNDVKVSMCGYCMEYDGGQTINMMQFPKGIITCEEALNPYSSFFLGAVCSKMYERSVLQEFQGQKIRFDEDITIGEDKLFWFKAVLNTEKIYVDNTPMYHYYVNENGAMKSRKFAGMYIDFLSRMRIVDLLSEQPTLKKFNIASCVEVAVQAMAVADCPTNDKRILELCTYVEMHAKEFMRTSQVSMKEKIRFFLVQTEISRRFLRFLLKQKDKMKSI